MVRGSGVCHESESGSRIRVAGDVRRVRAESVGRRLADWRAYAGPDNHRAAYNDSTGELIYLLTPDKAPFPSKANSHAVAPLYLIVYRTRRPILWGR